MSHVTVPGACHTTEPMHHDHGRTRDLVHQLSHYILAHLYGRADRLEQEAKELRQQAATHSEACRRHAGIEFVDLTSLHRVDVDCRPATPPCSVDGSAGGRRFDVV